MSRDCLLTKNQLQQWVKNQWWMNRAAFEIPGSLSPKQVYRLVTGAWKWWASRVLERSSTASHPAAQKQGSSPFALPNTRLSNQKWILHLGFLPDSSWDHRSVLHDNPGSRSDVVNENGFQGEFGSGCSHKVHLQRAVLRHSLVPHTCEMEHPPAEAAERPQFYKSAFHLNPPLKYSQPFDSQP